MALIASMLALVVLAVLSTAGVRADDVLADTDLVMTFLVHRHGDRTPTVSTVFLSTDVAAVEELSAPYGYGQLTDMGKRTAYRLGESLRARYGHLLSTQFNSSEIYIRSTDSTRTKMTVLTAMAAVFPAGDDNWSDSLPWQPTPYTTVPVRYDANMAMQNCPKMLEFLYSLVTKEQPRLEPYYGLLDRWSALIGFNITQLPLIAFGFYDVYTAQMSLGLPLPAELNELYPEIKELAGEVIDIMWGDDDYVPLQAGVLLQEFFTTASEAAAGGVAPVRIYSAHDFNVYSLMAAARVTPRQGAPVYGSSFALELRRRRDSDDLVVLPVYVRTPDAEPLFLQVDGCSALACPLDEFEALTADRVLDWATWRDQCGYTDDLVIDDADVA